MLDVAKKLWEKAKSSNFAKFVVGLTLILVAINWWFSGSLVMAVHEWMHPAPPPGSDDGGMHAAPPGAGLESGVGLVIWLVMALGGWVLSRVDQIAGLIGKFIGSPTVQKVVHDAGSAADAAMRQLLIDLGDAVLSNDKAKETELRWKIRQPQALAELVDAYTAADKVVWQNRIEELENNWSDKANG